MDQPNSMLSAAKGEGKIKRDVEEEEGGWKEGKRGEEVGGVGGGNKWWLFRRRRYLRYAVSSPAVERMDRWMDDAPQPGLATASRYLQRRCVQTVAPCTHLSLDLNPSRKHAPEGPPVRSSRGFHWIPALRPLKLPLDQGWICGVEPLKSLCRATDAGVVGPCRHHLTEPAVSVKPTVRPRTPPAARGAADLGSTARNTV